MDWAMTDDYAAITTSIMAAVQVIATVQFERLLREWTTPVLTSIERRWAAQDTVIARLKAGEEPTRQELATLRETTLLHRQAAGRGRNDVLKFGITGTLWATLSLLIVLTIARILRWSATPHHGPAPELASFVFLTTMVSVGALVLAVIVGVLARIGRNAYVDDNRQKVLRDHLEEVNRRLIAYGESLDTTPAGDDGSSTTGAQTGG
ncbi:hypothetical protein [Streptomyces spinosisporus]|uniref:DUF4231 domain-containing protein n=1 Tax=Streptomyces spinosisporus TaxID=2927582 RepID=A0ABS9XWR2_9ACTN|nr:hypothetical protein [Streptomyces spinosisporus]MCI3246519.1 hypothetical protein [Streptomyces spinosisporus]